MPLGKETERYSGGDMVGARRSALRGWRRHPGGEERREKDMRQMVSAGWALGTAPAGRVQTVEGKVRRAEGTRRTQVSCRTM